MQRKLAAAAAPRAPSLPPPAFAPATSLAKHAAPPALTLSAWRFAGLLLTYWCNARCAFCYVYSGPDRRGEMSRQTALHLWSTLDRHAAEHGGAMRIHLAGGEPLGDWPRLVSIVRAARDAGCSPLEKIETNAFWATSDSLTQARLELLDALGMQKLLVSADLYHQEFIPPQNVRRCVELARRVLGRGRVVVRWWDRFNKPSATPHRTRRLTSAAAISAQAQHRDRLTGRAADRLAPLLTCYAPEHFREEQCASEMLASQHVHIDGYGNIFPGVCSGIILGNALQRGVDQAWHDLARDWRKNPVVDALVHGGSYELMRRALPLGYTPRAAGYADKCHLCTHVRQFLVERGGWEQFVGPRECYAGPRDVREAQQALHAPIPLNVIESPA